MLLFIIVEKVRASVLNVSMLPKSKKEEQMDAKEMKKILAGVGIAGLLSGLPMGGGVAHGGSG